MRRARFLLSLIAGMFTAWIVSVFVCGFMVRLMMGLGGIAVRRRASGSERADGLPQTEEAIPQRQKWAAHKIALATLVIVLAIPLLPFSLGFFAASAVVRVADRRAQEAASDGSVSGDAAARLGAQQKSLHSGLGITR